MRKSACPRKHKEFLASRSFNSCLKRHEDEAEFPAAAENGQEALEPALVGRGWGSLTHAEYNHTSPTAPSAQASGAPRTQSLSPLPVWSC